MKFRFAIGLALTFAMPACGFAAGKCGRAARPSCDPPQPTVNFLAVPNITKEIVLAEPAAPAVKKPMPEDPDSSFYTGPFIGANKNEKAPTIGYYWSLH